MCNLPIHVCVNYIFFSTDNQIYSWGRGDNGRLGVLTDSLARAKGGIPCTAVPRPIFGALHVLSCVACRHWNSLIVAGNCFKLSNQTLSLVVQWFLATDKSQFSARLNAINVRYSE